MKLYLIQHGDAVSKQEDPDRPLSERGRADVDALARRLAGAGVTAERVINSGKLRARRTAEIIASSMVPTPTVEDVADGLRPNDSTDWLAKGLDHWTGDTIAVGHLPFMGKMVSRLVAGDEDKSIVAFVPGTAVCLERGESGDGWIIAWMITPDLLGS